MNLHSEIDRHLHANSHRIEDWRDESSLIMQKMRELGYEPIRGQVPVPMSNIEGSPGVPYMHVIELEKDGDTCWLAFSGEAGVADISKKKPMPADYS